METEPFYTLVQLLEEYVTSGMPPVLLETRRDFVNYGEVIGRMNAADNYRWDVFAPGIGRKLPTDVLYHVAHVHGIVLLPNQNHKIVVTLRGFPPASKREFQSDIMHLVNRYRKVYHQRARFVKWSELLDQM